MAAVTNGTREVGSETREVSVTLAHDKPVDQALRVAQSINAQTGELVARYPVGKDEYTAGYVLDADAPPPSSEEVTQTMINDFRDSMRMLQDNPSGKVAPALAAGDKATASDRKAAADRATVDGLDSVLASLQGDGARIDEMVVDTDAPTSELKQNSEIASAVDVAILAQSQSRVVESTAVNNYKGDARWAPKTGYIETRCCSTHGNRYVWQSFKWNDWRMRHLKSLRRNVTFEPDALYWKARGTYLGKKIRSWDSNMPKAYKDTQFGDSSSNASTYTVGTPVARSLKANKKYWTFMSTNKGGQNSDSAGLNVQQGKRIPVWCYRTWCVFPAGTDKVIRLNGYRVPGARSWYSDAP